MGGRFSALVLLLLFSCCLSGEPETVVKEKYLYVCSQGDVVSDPGRCESLEPRVLEVYRFVCFDGQIVDDSRDCLQPDLGTTTSAAEPDEPEETSSTTTRKVYSTSTTKTYRSTTTRARATSTTASEPSTTTTSSTTEPPTTSSTSTTQAPTTSSTTLPPSTTTSLSSEGCASLGCPQGTSFVGSKTSDKYHLCSCRYAVKIKPENIVCFMDRSEAEDAGYVPCGVCKP